SSDVCSSDLSRASGRRKIARRPLGLQLWPRSASLQDADLVPLADATALDDLQVDPAQMQMTVLGRQVELHRSQAEALHPLLASVVSLSRDAQQRLTEPEQRTRR